MSFSQKCYNLLRQVPPGQVTTYKDIAEALGSKAYRAVGQAMKNNPHAPQVPCHRVVHSNGRVGGFVGGTNKKISLLRSEGICIEKERIININKYKYSFRK